MKPGQNFLGYNSKRVFGAENRHIVFSLGDLSDMRPPDSRRNRF